LKIKYVAAGLLLSVLAGCGGGKDASRQNFSTAVTDYLDAHGDMCIDRSRWPIDVAAAQLHTRASEQLTALQDAGLVSAAPPAAGGAPSSIRFELTASGKRYYRDKKMISLASDGTLHTRDGDLCYGKLRLDKIIGWEAPRNERGVLRTVVTYTYAIEAAPWARNPAVQRMFPTVAMIVRSTGVLQLKQPVALTEDGWQGDLPSY
jgi:hypothetical protein